MNRIILTGILIAFIYFNSNAQIANTKLHGNSINLKVGYNKTYFKDINFSPLNYQSNSFALELGYSRLLKNNNLIFIDIGFSTGILKTKASQYFNANRYLTNFKIGYLRNLALSNKKTSLQIGGQYHTYLSMVFYDGVEAFTYYGFHGIDLIGKLNYNLTEKHKISTSLELPIFGVLVRPPYSGINKFQQENKITKTVTTGKWTSLNNYFALQWAIDYQYELSDKIEFILSNKFFFNQTKTLHSTKIIDNQILVGANFKF